jgi:methylenetetrahydrofolate--tRNA-(uracil-5-)-methyltransferase
VAPPPPTTALGALLSHITGGHLSVESESGRSFQPMNVNFGLFPPITVPRRPKTEEPRPDGRRQTKALARKNALSARALADLESWLGAERAVAAE